jgi:hypothetical protein
LAGLHPALGVHESSPERVDEHRQPIERIPDVAHNQREPIPVLRRCNGDRRSGVPRRPERAREGGPARAAAACPACDNYAFTGATALSQDNGWAVQFNTTGPSATGPATASSDTGTQMHGTLTGGIKGHAVDFTINWDGGLKGRYVGYVNEDGSWTGTTGDSGWKGLGPLQCLTQAPPPPSIEQVPKPLPAQIPPPVVVPIPAPTAKVTSDVDVYDKTSTDDKTMIGTLRAPSTVTLAEPCDYTGDCHVLVPNMQGGNGYAWAPGALQPGS